MCLERIVPLVRRRVCTMRGVWGILGEVGVPLFFQEGAVRDWFSLVETATRMFHVNCWPSVLRPGTIYIGTHDEADIRAFADWAQEHGWDFAEDGEIQYRDGWYCRLV